MKPKSEVKFDLKAFEKMKRILPSFLESQRSLESQEYYIRDLPEEVAFKLTNRCNLRCKHCFQWNENGHHHNLSKEAQNQDLDFDILEKVFAQTQDRKSNIYLWGGEPLIYRDWDKLVDLLLYDRRWTVICTNGISIETRLDSILSISETLEIFLAIEGFQEEHDTIRGHGTYQKTMQGLDLLLEQKRLGHYLGEITINCVITAKMVDRLYDLLEFFEKKGVDTVFLSFPWYISQETSAKMDNYFARNFNWVCTENDETSPSWHAYKYCLNATHVQTLVNEFKRVTKRTWKLKLRFQPSLDLKDIEEFIQGGDRPVQNKTRCLAIKTRMDIFPDGDVISCKLFPHDGFTAGNLANEDVSQIWHGEKFTKIRETIDRGLMPVCAKCSLLYQRGV
jgi:radical SAM protein with 4Fe4S-binding SPASM domain